MTEMEAAVALVQLQKLDSLNARIKLADEISSNLTSLPGFQLLHRARQYPRLLFLCY